MGKWLIAYREGQWRQAVDTARSDRRTKGVGVAWSSPTYGLRSGRVLMASDDGWMLVQGEHTPGLWVWVREDLLHAAGG